MSLNVVNTEGFFMFHNFMDLGTNSHTQSCNEWKVDCKVTPNKNVFVDLITLEFTIK